MSVPEAPRIWTLEGVYEGPNAIVVDGPKIGLTGPRFERVEVIEKAPVDAERERMLDVIERFWRECERNTEAGVAVRALLCEHDRLPQERKCRNGVTRKSRVKRTLC